MVTHGLGCSCVSCKTARDERTDRELAEWLRTPDVQTEDDGVGDDELLRVCLMVEAGLDVTLCRSDVNIAGGAQMDDGKIAGDAQTGDDAEILRACLETEARFDVNLDAKRRRIGCQDAAGGMQSFRCLCDFQRLFPHNRRITEKAKQHSVSEDVTTGMPRC